MYGSIKRKALKLAILGDSTVGKTSICRVFFGYEFDLDQIATIGEVKFEKNVAIGENEKIKLIIWDTAGQERFHSIALAACKSAQGILVCFDLTNEKTFKRIKVWLDEINNNYIDVPIVLFGNKLDMVEKRKISKEEAEKVAKELNLEYFETSAKDKTNIEKGIMFLVNMVFENFKNKKKNKTFSLEERNENNGEKDKCCDGGKSKKTKSKTKKTQKE